jgi:hypothetical protein
LVPPCSLPAPIRWFAEYEQFTSVSDTLTATHVGSNEVITIVRCVWVAVLSSAWSGPLYERQPKASLKIKTRRTTDNRPADHEGLLSFAGLSLVPTRPG